MVAPHRLVVLLAALCLIAGGLGAGAWAAPKAKKGKPGKPAATRPEKKPRKGRVAGRGRRERVTRSSRRALSRRRGPVPVPPPEVEIAPARLSLPDRIEVIEYGSAKFNPAPPRPAPAPAEKPFNISTRKIDVNIAPDRVTQIQQALAGKGCYTGEPTGLYDEATVEAMRQFQLISRIDVTGYPTAQALKLLGLTNW